MLKADLHFKSLQDFEPDQVAQRIKPLRDLLDLRTRLADLRGTLQGNEKLDELLQEVINSTEKLEKLRGELGLEEGSKGGSNE
jgi:type VI secretion system protein ImpB